MRTLSGEAFALACAALMRQAESQFAPTLLVGVRTGGLVVAHAMAQASSATLPVLALTCRRASTGTKHRLPFLRAVLGRLPLPVLDLMRHAEHRFLIAPRARRVRRQEIDRQEAVAIGGFLAGSGGPARVLVVDDAVDSGVTLATVMDLLRTLVPSGTEIRTAAITQTLDDPKVRPDYVMFRELCRFPWSFDAKN